MFNRAISLFILLTAFSCNSSNDKEEKVIIENRTDFREVGEFSLEGGKYAAEISTFDPSTGYLFVTNNSKHSRIDIIDINDPTKPFIKDSIKIGDAQDSKSIVNSLALKNNYLVAAIANSTPYLNGFLHIYNTKDFSLIKKIEVGALPDMVIFTPDGNNILVANEGEPDASYENDPEGSISIISIANDFETTNISFTSYNDSVAVLSKQGFRVFAPNATLAMDVEPEYIAISEDSKTAYVTLQENNGLAIVDIATKKITNLFGLGFKDFNAAGNEIDICDLDESVHQSNWHIYGMYQPDAIEFFQTPTGKYLITANEGDGRDYEGFSEEARISDIKLDSINFPSNAEFKDCKNIGRLKITTTLGDTDGDGDYDELYTFGARSFSIWDAANGKLIMDSKNRLETNLIENSNLYDDSRSDDKGIEPESVTVGKVGGFTVGFVGLERGNAVLTYDLSEPFNVNFLQLLATGIGPEGLLFIESDKSPNKVSMLIVSSEIDGKIKIFQPTLIE